VNRKGLSVAQGSALTLSAVLGTGVISLPALAARAAGPASLLAWLALVLLSVPMATTFAVLGARFPDGGGVSTYARLAFGERASTMVGWALYLTIPVGAPVAAGFAGAYVADALGGGRRTALVACVVVIAVVVVLNWFGIRVSASVQLGIAGAIALLLSVALAISLPHSNQANLVPFAPHGIGGIGSAVVMLLWAFAGWEILGSLSAEYRNPGRDIVRATAAAVVVVGVLYLGIAYATVAVLGPTAGPAPLSDLFVLVFGERARFVITVVAVALTFGAINAYFAGASRMGAALARDGALPRWLAAGSGPGEVPRRSLLLMTAITAVVLGGLVVFDQPTDSLLLVATGTFSLVYAFGAAAALRLLPRRSWGWRSALVSVVAAAGLLALTGLHLIAPAAFALAGLAWSLVRARSAKPLAENAPVPQCAGEGHTSSTWTPKTCGA
jgi:amino acid efflux transporter